MNNSGIILDSIVLINFHVNGNECLRVALWELVSEVYTLVLNILLSLQ